MVKKTKIVRITTIQKPFSVFSEDIRLEAEKNFIISEVKIFANSWNEDIPEIMPKTVLTN